MTRADWLTLAVFGLGLGVFALALLFGWFDPTATVPLNRK